MADENRYTALVFPFEGTRVGFITCKDCGAVLMLDCTEDPTKIHDAWHDRMDAVEENANSFRNHVHDTEDY